MSRSAKVSSSRMISSLVRRIEGLKQAAALAASNPKSAGMVTGIENEIRALQRTLAEQRAYREALDKLKENR